MQDVVYLKNGSIIRGMIIEQVPNKSMKVQTPDGSLFVLDINDVERITKEQTPNTNPQHTGNRQQVQEQQMVIETPMPLKPFALQLNVLGVLQFGPVLQAEFKLADWLVLGPYIRLFNLGAASHAIVEYTNLRTAYSLGIGTKVFYGNKDEPDRWFYGYGLEYGYGEGHQVGEWDWPGWGTSYGTAYFEFSYIAAMNTGGYRWRYSSGINLSVDLLIGLGYELTDEQTSPQHISYDNDLYFIGMLEFSIGYEF